MLDQSESKLVNLNLSQCYTSQYVDGSFSNTI